MRIICPTCASHYEVDEARIAAQGQLVRCARCRDVWLVRAPKQQDQAADACAVAPSARQAPTVEHAALSGASEVVVDFNAAKVRLRPRNARAKTRAWATSLTSFAVGAVALAGLTTLDPFRATIAARFPQAVPLYAAIGLPIPSVLALSEVRSVLVAEGGETVLTLQGRILNTGDKAAAVPNLKVVVRGNQKVPLYTWTTAPPKPTLAQGEAVDFRSRLASPPPAGRDVRVSFDMAAAAVRVAAR